MRCALGLFTVSTLVAQQPAPDAALPATGEVTVDRGARFEPLFWTLRCDLPAGKDWIVSHRPWAEVQRKNTEGEYVLVECQEPRVAGSTADRFPGVRAFAGETFAWRAEVTDPRVVGVLGEYRLRVQWGVADVRLTPWTSFEIGGASTEARLLAAAEAAQDDAWKAYCSCMSEPLSFAPLGQLRTLAPQGAGMALAEIIGSERSAARLRLREMPTLPARVRHRVQLLDIASESWRAQCAADEQQAHAHWALVEARCASLRREASEFHGDVASLVQLGAWDCLGQHGDLVDAPWSASAIAVAITFPALQGLKAAKPSLEPSGGPWPLPDRRGGAGDVR